MASELMDGVGLNGLSSSLRSEWRFAFMQAWIDDSGSDLGGPVFVYAGFLGKAERWQQFADEWDAKLKESPSIAYFKMHEAAGPNGQFKNWTSGAVNRKIEKLIKVILKYAEASLFTTFSLDDYKRLLKGKRDRIPSEIDFPQFLTFHGLIAGTLRKFERYIDFFFDIDEINGPRISRYWETLKQVIPFELEPYLQPQPLFRDDRVYKPLQAADMLAWNLRRMASGHDDSWQWIIEGLSEIPSFTQELNAEKLESFTRPGFDLREPRLWLELDDDADQFKNFDETMRSLVSLPSAKGKKTKKRKSKKSSASGRASNGKD